MKITAVEIIELCAALPEELRRARQLSVRAGDLYDRSEATESHDRVCQRYVRVTTDGEHAGLYGPVSEAALAAIRNGLAQVLHGSDPRAHNLAWERMLRSERHLRTGHGIMGVSALDNALWDLRGRLLGLPVCDLLGGATRARIPAYASTLGYLHDEEELVARSRELAEEFGAQKWFFRLGPANRVEALTSAVTLAETLRATVGAGYPLMFDAVMGWDLALAESWCRRVAPVEPTWLEEPFPAYDLASYRKLSSAVSVPLAAGEHVYGRWEASAWLGSGVLRYLQCDPEWCGGTSELVRIATLCSTSGTVLVPHGANIHAALHVVASLPPWLAPYVEFLIDLADERALFERAPVRPEGGFFAVPTAPGFGIELDLNRADEVEVWSSANA